MNNIEWTSLRAVLEWLASGVGAGVVAFFLWELGERVWKALRDLNALAERAITLTLTAALGLGAFWMQVWVSYRPAPETWVQGLEQGFSVVAMAIIAALAIHGIKQKIKE